MSDTSQHMEQENIRQAKATHPSLFREPTFIDDQDFLARFGINIPKIAHPPKAYVKMYAHDFIVEEIDNNAHLHSIQITHTNENRFSGKGTWACTLVKCGITTIEAIKDISLKLGIAEQHISFAGIKDKQGITSQQIVIKDVEVEDLQHIQSKSFFIKDIRPFKGFLNQGSLKGNKFTLRLRFESSISKERADAITHKITEISRDGYYNFFYLQRFGIPRFLSHAWGMYILQHNEKALIESVLFEDSPNELEFFRKLRQEASVNKHDMKKVQSLYEKYPIYLGQENTLLKALSNGHTINYGEIKSYAQLWVHAFSSLLWNEVLTHHIKNHTVPKTLPLPLTENPAVQAAYKPYFQFLDIAPIKRGTFSKLPFILLQDKEIETRGSVENMNVNFNDSHMNVSFILPKGSYATCLLSHLVDIVSGTPLPGMNTEFMFDDVLPEHIATIDFFKESIQNSQYRLSE